MRPITVKTIRAAALVAQWRAPAAEKAQIKAARLSKRAESIEPLIRRFVTDAELRAIQKRGCAHSVDFPEKRDRTLRRDEGG